MISDIHNKQNVLKLPSANLLLVAGDMTSMGTYEELSNFANFLSSQKTKFDSIIVVAGNHEVTIDTDFFNKTGKKYFPKNSIDPLKAKSILAHNSDFIYLEDSGTEYKGVKIWGTPWIPPIGDWAFSIPNQEFAQKVFGKIPEDTDIVISHSPPHGIMDEVLYYEYKKDPKTYKKVRSSFLKHCGDIELMKRIKQVQPKLHVFGHIHECSGVELHENTMFVNAAILDHEHLPRNLPKKVVLNLSLIHI